MCSAAGEGRGADPCRAPQQGALHHRALPGGETAARPRQDQGTVIHSARVVKG